MKIVFLIVVGFLALIGLAVLVGLFWLKLKVGRGMRERSAQWDADQEVMEEAEWIGKTGLGEDDERELPRYLRRELGETLADPEALKASDLVYLGACDEKDGPTHYWYMPFGKDEVYAYIIADGANQCTGWGGGRVPSDPAMREQARKLREARAA
ncbi:hypothetical protein DSM104443_04081 [Usitatibacter rugosus]|uniref:Uncharacterized protein n=1 Tax=Usitatibacter rugosus TaxID=2732067 RepID=A0A6M4H4Z0_9PROT|nr:hypothetical protein [Usitatibacter rugosus]QJR12987.1 hypothetical protein DSM104443_04081 [Usitatibacter rugosus]